MMTLPRQLIVARTECGRVFMEAVTAPAVLAQQLLTMVKQMEQEKEMGLAVVMVV